MRRGIVIAALVGGCGGEEGGVADSGRARGAPPDNHVTSTGSGHSNPSAASDSVAPYCPATGLWSECTLIERLEQAGLVLTSQQDPAMQEPLERQGVGFSVRHATIEAYFYPTESERARDQRRLPQREYLQADQPPGPVHKPTVVTSANLLVILDTRRERQRERITLAITAGPPQPPGP